MAVRCRQDAGHSPGVRESSLASVFDAFSNTTVPAPSPQPPRQVKSEHLQRRRTLQRHRHRYMASTRRGKALNGVFCCHGCHILLHTVVLHFCPHPDAVSIASDLSVLESLVQGDLFSQRKIYSSHHRAGGDRGSLLCSHET